MEKTEADVFADDVAFLGQRPRRAALRGRLGLLAAMGEFLFWDVPCK